MTKSAPFSKSNILQYVHKLKGSLSVFISTILVPLILVFSMVCESARLGNQKAMYASALYLSSYSVLAAYCQELYEDYGLFALLEDKEAVAEDCSKYLSKNLLQDSGTTRFYKSFYRPDSFSSTVEDILYLTDGDGKYFAKSAINYSKDTLISDVSGFVISEFHKNSSVIGSSQKLPVNIDGLDLSSMDEETVADMTENAENSSSNCMDIIKNTITSENLSSVSFNEIMELIPVLMSTSLLSIVAPNATELSKLAIKLAYLPSETRELSEEAEAQHSSFDKLEPTKNTNLISDGLDKTFFIRYLSEEFTCYSDFSEDNSLDAPLLYQLEYILNGADTDLSNLLFTAIALVVTRAQLNFAYIMTDSDKVSVAKSAAEAAFAEFGIPGLVELATLVILVVWSLAEGIVDCRDLMHYKKVPLIKTKASWTLSLENIGKIMTTTSKNKGDTGLSYKDYVLSLLMLQNSTDTYFQTMDVIQVCIEHSYDTYFRMNDCIYGFTATLTTESHHIFNFLLRHYSVNKYTLKNTKSITY